MRNCSKDFCTESSKPRDGLRTLGQVDYKLPRKGQFKFLGMMLGRGLINSVPCFQLAELDAIGRLLRASEILDHGLLGKHVMLDELCRYMLPQATITVTGEDGNISFSTSLAGGFCTEFLHRSGVHGELRAELCKC